MKRALFTVVFCLGAYIGFSQDAAALINAGNDALQEKDYAKAYESYEKAIASLGNSQVDSAIFYNIGFAAMQAEKFEAAIANFAKAIAAKANVARAYELTGSAFARLEKYDEAIDAYKKAVAADAEDKGGIYYNAGIVAYQADKFDQAVQLFDLAIAENYEKSETAYFNKALALRKGNKIGEYKQTLVEASEKFPADEKISGALANVYVSEGNALYRKGAAILNAANKKVEAGSIKTVDAAYTTEVDKSKAEFKAALQILEKAKALDADNANASKLIDACKAML